jgi:hypothetical protein
MTRLSNRKRRLVLETAQSIRERGKDRPIVAEPTDAVLQLRLKGTRRVLVVNWSTIYYHAAKLHADLTRRQREEARKAKRAARLAGSFS